MKDYIKNIGISAYGNTTKEQVEHAVGMGFTTYQVILGDPQRYWPRRESGTEVLECRKLMAGHVVVCHAPFLINFADDVESKSWKFSLNSIKSHSNLCKELGINRMVIHSGSDKGRGEACGANSWRKALKELRKEFPDMIYLIENNAYKKNRYSSLECLGRLVTHLNSRVGGVGICLDTAHAWSAGELGNIDVIKDQVQLLHLNDHSMDDGCNKDKHADTA